MNDYRVFLIYQCHRSTGYP